MSGEELQAAVTNRNAAHSILANRRKALIRGINLEGAACNLNIKGYSHALNCKKPVSAFRAIKKGGFYFERAYAIKKLVPRLSLPLQPCTHKPHVYTRL
jgi:hypothetical protein